MSNCVPVQADSCQPMFQGVAKIDPRYLDGAKAPANGTFNVDAWVAAQTSSVAQNLTAAYNCSGSDATASLRYLTSFFCATAIRQGGAVCPGNTLTPWSTQLCDTLQGSVAATTMNQTICASGSKKGNATAASGTVLPGLSVLCTQFATSSANLSVAAGDETSCGFGRSTAGVANAVYLCQTQPSLSCCSQVTQSTNSTPPPSTAPSNATSDGPSTPVWIPIVATVAGLLGLVALVGLFLLVRRRSRSKGVSSAPEAGPPPKVDSKAAPAPDSEAALATRPQVSGSPPVLPLPPILAERQASRPFSPVARPSTPPSGARIGNARVRAAYAYDRRLTDEISIHSGDILVVEAVYKDGWACGTNTRSGSTGVFPLACLDTGRADV